MIRRASITATIAFIAVSTFGQEHFRLSRIEVQNTNRVSPRLIVAETLLREGQNYTEDDVRTAVARLGRLPFLLNASYTLNNGVLVITVTEMRQFSVVLDARGILFGDRNYSSTDFDYDFSDPTTPWKNAAVGLRWQTDGAGTAHAVLTVLRNRQGLSKNYSAYEIGYTRYDLFGTRLFARANVRSPVDSLEEKTFTPSVLIGFPVTSSQTLTFEHVDTLFESHTFRLVGNDFRVLHAERLLTLAWTYDTTNAPYAPTRGTFVRLAPMRWMRDDADFESVRTPERFIPNATHINANGVDVAAVHHWELSERHSMSLGMSGGWAEIDREHNPPRASSTGTRSKTAYEILEGGYSRALGSTRLELEGRLIINQRNDPSGDDTNESSFEVGANWVWRSTWGTVRAGLNYAPGP